MAAEGVYHWGGNGRVYEFCNGLEVSKTLRHIGTKFSKF
jgi:hypothetical protein